MSGRRRFVVVGGGITGLAAAWELTSDPGVDVVLFEAADRLGGKIHSSRFAGRIVDEGADAFLRRVPEGLALVEELGLTDTLVSPAATSALVWAGDELRPLPGGTVLGVPVDADAVAAGGLLSDEAIAAIRREPDLPGEPLRADESLGSLVRRRFGDEVLSRLVEPLVGGINAGEADRLSVDAVVPQISAAARRSASLTVGLREAAAPAGAPAGPVFAAPRGSMGSLVGELVAGLAARGVDLHVGAAVEAVEPTTGGGWRVAASDGTAVEVDGVILATPAAPTAGVLRPLAPTAADLLAGIGHASVVLVTLAVRIADVPRALDASGFLVPRDAGLAITAASWSSSKWAHLADPDVALLRVSAGHRDDPASAELPDDQLLAAIAADLDTTMGLRAEPIEVRVSRYPDGFPQYDIGHLDRIAAVEGEVRERCPGLVVTGAAHRGLGVPACIRQGRTAAHHLLGADS